MKNMQRFLVAVPVLAFFLAFAAAATPASPNYDAYHSALNQLRTARAYIEHPDSGELHDQEKSAMAEIDQAVTELEVAGRIVVNRITLGMARLRPEAGCSSKGITCRSCRTRAPATRSRESPEVPPPNLILPWAKAPAVIKATRFNSPTRNSGIASGKVRVTLFS